MKFEQLVILLPCHSLEDFPQHLRGEDAGGLLACWTALWHPALLATAGSAPVWFRAEEPPQLLPGRLIVVPAVSQAKLPAEFAERAGGEGASCFPGTSDRETLLRQILEQLDGGDGGVDGDLAKDFLALGYGFLQIQILTRQMRYSSSLDEVNFNSHLLAAARSAMSGDHEAARGELATCFNLLSEERDHFYAVDAFLLDLTVLAEGVFGEPLRAELVGLAPKNVLLSGADLGRIVERHPDTLVALREALSAGKAGLVGGEDVELCSPLVSCESVLAELRRGLDRSATELGRRADVYGRRRFGLTPLLPQILGRLGFRGACHATLDDGRFPEGSQVKTRWEGADGMAIDALAKVPLDAARHETFICLGTKLGESMDMDHVATLWFAHWPGRACAWYDDLQRCARYGTALGRFVTMEAYFRDTYVPGHLDRFDADQYRSPYLRQAVVRGSAAPISAVVRYWRCRARLEAAQSLGVMLAAVGQSPRGDLSELECAADRCLEEEDAGELERRLSEVCGVRRDQLAASLAVGESPAPSGCLIVNPCSFARRVGLELPDLSGPPSPGRPVYAAARADGEVHAVVDLPAMGFVWVTPGTTSARASPAPLLAEDRRETQRVLVLRNEYFEAWINPATGSLAALKDYNSRHNRLSQQIAFRAAGAGPRLAYTDTAPADEYSTMVAETVEIARATTAVGEIVARGSLRDRQQRELARFRQTYRAWRGSRVLQLEIHLEPGVEPGPEPWDSYYASRVAWADETAGLSRSVQQTHRSAAPRRLEACHYLEISAGAVRTAILTAGLPYHRRVGHRMLDSLLVVRGESERDFRLGIGVDLTHPMQEAIGLLSPPLVCPLAAAPPNLARSSWLFHLDSKSVVATHWSPLIEDGRCAGFRARFLETCGRPACARLSCCRPIQRARQVDFLGKSLGECRLDEGRPVIDLSAHQWVEVEVRWS